MKHLNIEIIAAILDSKIQKNELKKYKNHIDKCDDCMIMYSSIKSNLNESKQHTIEVSDSYKSYIENQLINKELEKPLDTSKIPLFNLSRNNNNSYLARGLSIAAMFIFVFYLGVKDFNDSEPIVANDIESGLINDYNNRYDQVSNDNDSNKKLFNDFFEKIDNKNIPNFEEMNIIAIIDTLEKLNVNYKILPTENIHKITTEPKTGTLFNIKTDTLYIYLPSNNSKKIK